MQRAHSGSLSLAQGLLILGRAVQQGSVPVHIRKDTDESKTNEV